MYVYIYSYICIFVYICNAQPHEVARASLQFHYQRGPPMVSLPPTVTPSLTQSPATTDFAGDRVREGTKGNPKLAKRFSPQLLSVGHTRTHTNTHNSNHAYTCTYTRAHTHTHVHAHAHMHPRYSSDVMPFDSSELMPCILFQTKALTTPLM